MEKLNIYQKLLEVQKKVMGLKKDKKGFNYSYVTGDKLLGFIKPVMNDVGLLLKQEVVNIEKERVQYKTSKGVSKDEFLYSVWCKFTWVDTETGEKDENSFFASGMNEYEKGLGSALTYAERYFLLKFFHIATDEDDINNPDRKPNEPKKEDVNQHVKDNKIFNISDKQAYLLKSEIKKRGEEAIIRMKEILYKEHIDRIEEIQIKDFNSILAEIKKLPETQK